MAYDSDPGDVGALRTVQLQGELDLATATLHESQLERAAEEAPQLIVDLSELSFIDTAGIALLFRVTRRYLGEGRQVAFVARTGSVARRVLELVVLPTYVPVEPSLDAARRALQHSPRAK
jgi:anti-anti-sigma factor